MVLRRQPLTFGMIGSEHLARKRVSTTSLFPGENLFPNEDPPSQ
jgi:hypothetical protein